jgi:hypothetical protein
MWEAYLQVERHLASLGYGAWLPMVTVLEVAFPRSRRQGIRRDESGRATATTASPGRSELPTIGGGLTARANVTGPCRLRRWLTLPPPRSLDLAHNTNSFPCGPSVGLP